MQVRVVRQVERGAAGELAACGLLAFAISTAAGFVLSELFGTGGHRRLRRLLRRRKRPHATPGGRALEVGKVREALQAEPALAEEAIEVRPRGRGLELRGWVRSRTARALAYRAARAAAGPVECTNHLRVRGEDDAVSATRTA